MDTVVIGMDPHKRSATIEARASDETVLGHGVPCQNSHTGPELACPVLVRPLSGTR